MTLYFQRYPPRFPPFLFQHNFDSPHLTLPIHGTREEHFNYLLKLCILHIASTHFFASLGWESHLECLFPVFAFFPLFLLCVTMGFATSWHRRDAMYR